MSAPQLPEDLSRWPDDPFELLGVRRGIAPRDLRRVYTGLIRTYKPEQFPEHFRRIRSAYESVLRHIELFQHFHFEEESTTSEDGDAAEGPQILPAPRELPPEEGDDEADTPIVQAPVFDLHRNLKDAWELACSGKEPEAYERLRRLQETQPGESDVYLRLYWLLALMPEIDSNRTPIDWLLTGVRHAGLGGPLRELLRRELAEFPGLSVSATCTQLFRGNASPSALLDLLEIRWRAAQERTQWNLISDDVRALGQRFLHSDESSWARLLLMAIDFLAWAPLIAHRDPIAGWRKELEQAIHLHGSLGAEMDRLDFLIALAEAWRQCGQLPGHASFLPLIRDSWTRPPNELRLDVQAYLAEVAQNPTRFLEYFDVVAASAPDVLTQFGKVLIDYASGSDVEMPPEECSTAANPRVLELLEELDSDQYRWLRPKLLALCVNEAVSPEAVAGLVQGRPTFWVSGQTHLSQALAGDWALRYVFLSCWLFWQ
jgi:hypothetical protein